jgi:radical SAM-linked protein
MFERALARANLPVRYSEGFNPRPRLTIALPRPVGVASRDELLVIELTAETAPEEALSRLQAHMPAGLTLLKADRLADAEKRVPCEALYELELGPNAVEGLDQRITEFLTTTSVTIHRTRRAKSGAPISGKSVDVRSFVLKLQIDDATLRWTQSISQDGTARLAEVLEALNIPAEQHLHKVRRVQVVYRS